MLTEGPFRPVRERQGLPMLTGLFSEKIIRPETFFLIFACMTLFLTGSPTRFGEPSFTEDNGFLAEVKAALAEVTGGRRKPRVLLVSAAPDDEGFTESVKKGMSECIHASGIPTASITMLDRRNAHQAKELVKQADWIILCGGHVPTQNRFLHESGLKGLMEGFDGVVMGCSAGSMNCADEVYSHPELPGEARDPQYRRWLRGLGYSLSLDPDTSSFTDGQLGEYELGSVFEKDIVIRVSPRNIRKAIREYPEAFETFPKEVRFTVFHEVGHALLEQLIDYANNIEDFLPNIEAKYGDKFFDVFDDENLTEEELAEDFARAF